MSFQFEASNLTRLLVCLITIICLSLFLPLWRQSLQGTLVGRFARYWYARNITKGPSSFVHALHVDKGQKIVRLGRNEFSITDPALLGTIYGDRSFVKSEQYAAFDGVEGESSIFSMRDDEEHGRRVKAVRGMFKALEVGRKASVVEECVGRAMACLHLVTSGGGQGSGEKEKNERRGRVNVLDLMRGFAVEVVSEFALGVRYLGDLDMTVSEVGHSFGLVLDDINNSAASFGRSTSAVLKWCVDVSNKFSTFWRAREGNAAATRNYALEEAYALYTTYCKQMVATSHNGADYKLHLDLLGLSARALETELGDLLFAGTDSAATTLSTALWHIYSNPSVLQKLREDLEYVDDDQLVHRPYLSAVVDEALRIAQPVPRRLPRIVPINKDIFYAEDKHNDDWHKILPAGATVGISAYSLHRDTVFDRAEEFVPERWLTSDKDSRERMRQCFIPFGRGHRACIGQELARCEMRLILSRVVNAFDGEALGSAPKYIDNFNASIDGSEVMLLLRPRSNHPF